MARLIEVHDARVCPSPLAVRTGDVLLFRAAGGRVRSGAAVEALGPFVPGEIGDHGEVLTPMGPPNAILFRARRPGRAAIEVVTGDPFHAPQTTELEIDVAS
jgi:hypothetical protein